MKRRLVPLVLLGMFVSGCGSEASLSQDALDRVRAQGVAPDLVYVVDLPGYELAEQSIGGVGEDGFGAFYVSPEGRQVELRVDRGTFGDALCADTPITDAEPPTAPVRCERDEAGWYRRGGGRHEYTAVRADHLIWLKGRIGEVDRAALKAAVSGARHATGDGSSTPVPPPGPVERGDLPTSGDGAPDNEAGPGG
ncbi:hypothetical protein [Streptosporangium sp. NBC_01756]|uniref:hypothetical protein n=1 Tax=Streptosporangium sp. NBC_01756 TaxID=2975950 RepID=UPI002DDC868D|nr:hypothetical protein [Streptosporangium sp. NBC_01756]WSC87005.1 hypothetical protein OIE48_01925 [Streptosporangium sp. NBC_01756]